MTMRTYRHFVCPNGHRGEEKTSENDQPYSKHWEQVTLTGMRAATSIQNGEGERFVCLQCGADMIPAASSSG
ncbi:hypothetical protein GCM10007933_15320 [Zoogloea oryzae]|uniref:Uncharacterized protein n=1 Tax=Zoogloea oryzae TaxID=310767 RepID=A0ABQ6FAY8_9RHOO|nr:hypothetical protein GCM10007933_15320 [Zoogloea oryzae]